MTVDIKPFQPKIGGSITVANATTASPPALLEERCEQVALTNTSATAIAYFRCGMLPTQDGDGTTASVARDFPVLPLSQVRLTVGAGWKKFSVIASEADGALILTPGTGN